MSQALILMKLHAKDSEAYFKRIFESVQHALLAVHNILLHMHFTEKAISYVSLA